VIAAWLKMIHVSPPPAHGGKTGLSANFIPTIIQTTTAAGQTIMNLNK